MTTGLKIGQRTLLRALIAFGFVASAHAQDADPFEAESSEAPETIAVDPLRQDEAAADPVPEQTVLDAIEVTGSRIRRTDYETAQPIAVISREDIERTGLTSIGDLLQELPQAGAALNTAFNGYLDIGGVEVDLRNLGSNRVLVLVNGHRWVNGLRSLSTSSVDLSTIPISVVERIEVLKDGASAVYGSDAIAGVVNIITRKDYAGAEFRGYFGGYGEGDGLTQNYSVSLGNIFNRTSLFFDLSHTRQSEIFNGDRELTRLPIYGTGLTRGSGNTPQGRLIFIPTPATEAALRAVDPQSCPGLVPVESAVPEFPFPGTVGAVPLCIITTREGTSGESITDFRAYDSVNDPYNFAPDNYLLTPYEQTAAFAQIAHDLTESISFRSELLYNLRSSEQNAAPMPMLGGDLAPPPYSMLYIDVTNPYNPFGQDIARGVGGPLTPGSGVFGRRPLEYGPRLYSQDVDTLRGGFTLSGPLDLAFAGLNRLLNWELGYSYGESKEKEILEGNFNLENMARALGPIIECTDDCVPLNLFGGQGPDGQGTITQEMLDYITYVGISRSSQTIKDAYLNLSTELFELPAGALGIALGFEYREEFYRQQPDPFVVAGISSSNSAKPTAGGYDSKEAFVELGIPVVRDLPMVRELDISLAGRYSDYAGFGEATTYKAGLRWKPLDDLLVRATKSTAFRAPSVGELFLGDSASFPGLADPCAADYEGTDTDATQNAFLNCRSDLVVPSSTNVLAQLLEIFRGNPELEPETAHTLTAGIVYSPGVLPDLTMYFDWYRITIDDYITVPGSQYILDACYTAPPEERRYCEYVNRNQQSGNIESVINPFLNFSKLETEGFDLTLAYTLRAGDFGRLRLLGDAAYLTQYDLISEGPGGGSVVDEYAGDHIGLGPFPRWKANATLAWDVGGWNASWSARYIHSMEETCNDIIFTPSLRDLGVCSHPDPDVSDGDDSRNVLPKRVYHNVQIGYLFADQAFKVTLGANNVLDAETPPSYAFLQSPTWEPTAYEIPGRFFYMRLHKDF
jgi:iron complex outermembrane recepter protein